MLSRRRRSHLFSTSVSFLPFFLFSLHPALARSPFSLPLFPFLVSSSLFVPAIVTPLPFRLVRLLSRDSFLSHSLLIPKTLVPRPLFPEALTSPRRVFSSLAGLGRQAGRRTSTRTFLLCSVQLCLFLFSFSPLAAFVRCLFDFGGAPEAAASAVLFHYGVPPTAFRRKRQRRRRSLFVSFLVLGQPLSVHASAAVRASIAPTVAQRAHSSRRRLQFRPTHIPWARRGVFFFVLFCFFLWRVYTFGVWFLICFGFASFFL